MFDKPAEEWTKEDWLRLHRAAYALSEKLLELAEEQDTLDGTFSVQVAGYAFLIAIGRLSGRHGFRHIAFDDAWKLWTDDAAKKQVEIAFNHERRSEN